MPKLHEIRADHDANTIVRQRFVAPFSFNRMTWIKPSFLWLMLIEAR